MALISINNLTFGYEGSHDLVFENATLQLDTRWRLGLIGRNGRGKTTLLRLLLGQLDAGGAIWGGGSAFEYFPYPVKSPEKPGLEVALAACPGLELWQLERELSLLDLDPAVLERPFATLSHGEQTKVLLAALFLRENAFPLIDEPTNHLDMAAREKVAEYLERKAGFILVSHDRIFLDRCIDHVMSINRANIEVQSGNFSSWWHNKQQQDAHEMAENERLKKDVKRLREAARRTAQWSDKVESTKIGEHTFDRGAVGAQAARMMKRSKAIERRRESAADEKSRLLRNIDTADSLKLHPRPYHNRRLVSLEEVAVGYDGLPAVSDVSFHIEQGERVALRGPNGSGKTSLLRAVLGELRPLAGRVQRGSGLIISYVSQATHHLAGSLRDYADRYGVDESLLLAILRKLDFSRTQFEKNIEDFSQGQKKKVLIARSLCEHAHLYVWDEPLNYIDVLSRMQIEQLILEYAPTLLFVEHDRAFCDQIATKTVFL